MKEVAILLLVALLLNGCGTSSTATQTAAGGTWQAQMLGGEGPASGFSFITEFSVSGGGGGLTISSFQFLTQPACFQTVNGETPTGTMTLIENPNTYAVTGTLVFTVQSGNNMLVLNGTVTGTENGLNGTTLSGAMATGTWTFTGSGTPTGCNDTSGSFTMTQS
jgi:hypothetical protein